MADTFDNAGEVKLRDSMEKRGISDISYDGATKKVTGTLNGKRYAYDTSGLTNKDGSLYGTGEQINKVLGGGQRQLRDAAQQGGVSVGFDRFNNPMLNGTALSRNGLTNIGGNWYGDESYIDNAVEAAKTRYKDPYETQRGNLLEQLMNYKKFAYDPQNDTQLLTAMELSRRQAQRDAENRGQGNSFGSDYASAAAAQALIPQYEEKAYERYIDGRNYLAQLLGLVGTESDRNMNMWATNQNQINADRSFNYDKERDDQNFANADREFDYTKQRDEISDAWARENFDYNKQRDNISDEWRQKEFDTSNEHWQKDHDLQRAEIENNKAANSAQAAFNLWQQLGVASNGIAQAINNYYGYNVVEPGASTLEYQNLLRSWNENPKTPPAKKKVKVGGGDGDGDGVIDAGRVISGSTEQIGPVQQEYNKYNDRIAIPETPVSSFGIFDEWKKSRGITGITAPKKTSLKIDVKKKQDDTAKNGGTSADTAPKSGFVDLNDLQNMPEGGTADFWG